MLSVVQNRLSMPDLAFVPYSKIWISFGSCKALNIYFVLELSKPQNPKFANRPNNLWWLKAKAP
jgi:hypothetical protein